jgi:V/A-type H+-transporting ATPase subunit F
MKKIVFITTGDAEYGFKLTGLDHYVIEEQKVEETLRKITGEPDVGLVIIDERLIKGINEETLKRIEGTWHGIFIVLPSPEKAKVEIEDYAARLIRRAIGYHVRLKL